MELKGEVKVISINRRCEKFKRFKTVLIEGEVDKIYRCKFQKDRVILKLEGIDTMNDAENLKQNIIEVQERKTIELEADTFYVSDLKECTVYDTNGKEIGEVFDVIRTTNNDVYWIKRT